MHTAYRYQTYRLLLSAWSRETVVLAELAEHLEAYVRLVDRYRGQIARIPSIFD